MMGERLKEFLADHPKLVSVLFSLMVLLAKAGSVLASGGDGYGGP